MRNLRVFSVVFGCFAVLALGLSFASCKDEDDGGNNNNSGGGNDNGGTTTPTTCTVSFNANGGSGTAPNPITVNAGSGITIPNEGGLSKSGFTFGGWNTNQSGTGTNYNAGSSFTPTADITMYAKWTANSGTTCTVTFNANGGTPEPPTQSVTAGEKLNPPSAMLKSGFVFGGWFKEPDFTNQWNFATDTVTRNITLHAKWNTAQATEGLLFTLLSNGNTYSVSKGTATAAEVVIPATYEGKPVIEIAEYGFFSYTNMTSITMSNIVTIGENAFSGCTGLTSVAIPNSVTGIGANAFNNCTSLTSITLPFVGNGNTSPYNTSFSSIFGTVPASLKTVVITGGNSIAYNAFSGCGGLTSITLPNSVTSIGQSAFQNCTSLANINIPNSVTSIGIYAFSGCTSLTSITIPNSVLTIGQSAFSSAGLTSVTIPDSVMNIPAYTFQDCIGLTSAAIPNSVTNIGSSAFNNCASLTSITLPFVGLNATSSGYFYSIFGSSSTAVPASLKTVVITGGNSIAYNAFSGCGGLTSITLPNSVTSIGQSAFQNCTSLANINIPNSVTSIPTYAFQNCSSLPSIMIPDSVTSIGSSAFSGCSSLESITIPFVGESRTAANANALFGYIFGTSSYTGGTATQQYYVNYSYTTYYIPTSLREVIITGNSIGDYAFSGCTGLTSITIPNSVTSIGNSAFSDCTGLTSITIPASVTSIGIGAFSGCTGLTSITIPNSVTSIANSAFSGCTGLTSITIGNSVTSIGDSAFNNCTGLMGVYITDLSAWCKISFSDNLSNPLYYAKNLYINGVLATSITIPNSVTSIAIFAFVNCSSLTSITIPNSVTSIAIFAFLNCSSLTSITIPNSVTSIANSAFSGCTGLTSITLPFVGLNATSSGYFHSIFGYFTADVPASLKTVVITGGNSIANSAFSGLDGLTSITIPNSVTSIGERAFRNCTGLTSVTIPDSVTSIGNEAFSFCSGLTSVTIPNSVASIGYYAFDNCTGLSSVTFQGTITSANFSNSYPFPGDLRNKYFATGGGIGTYTTTNPGNSAVWIKQ